MPSRKSDRPQNQSPDHLILSRKAVAQRNYEAVRVTIQALRHRGVAPDQVTVQSVANESGVSIATIYRRDDLFALVQRINPHLQRRPIESIHQQEATRLRHELEEARKETDYYQKESGVAKLGDRRLQQENVQLRKRVLDLQHRVTHLEGVVARCTCGGNMLEECKRGEIPR
jgi:hypothetical protein